MTPTCQTSGDTPAWYAIETRPRWEKKIDGALERAGVPRFLPLVAERRRWSDRIQVVRRCLFPGYLFVHVPADDRLRVLRVGGVVRMVGAGTTPTPIDDDYMALLRRLCEAEVAVAPFPWVEPGDRVRLRSGPLRGLEGTLVETRGRHYVVVSVDLIRRAAAVVVDVGDVERVG